METETQALTLPQRAQGLIVKDQASYDTAANIKIELAKMRKEIVERHEAIKKEAKSKWDDAVKAEKDEVTPVKTAEDFLVVRIKTYLEEQERLWKIEQAKVEAEARRVADEDRLRREFEAKAIRDAELAAQAEVRRRDEEARLAAALEAQVVGASEETVQQILETPVVEVPEVAAVEAYIAPAEYVAPAIAAPLVQKVVGTGIRYTWSAVVVDLKKLCQAVVDGVVPADYVMGNMPVLNKRAGADQTAMEKTVPGTRAVRK